MKRNKEGFTLVEIIAALAILMIVGGSILLFLLNGLKQYQKIQTQTDIQYDAQTTLNQLEDLFIDVNSGIYSSGSAEETQCLKGTVLEMEGGVNHTVVYQVMFIKNKGELTYEKYIQAEQGKERVDLVKETVLCKNVKQFSAQITEQECNTVIHLTLELLDKTSSCNAKKNITLRNLVEIQDGQ
ncbi:MAG: type II secretion system protein [Lachnospiraceae bacterium]